MGRDGILRQMLEKQELRKAIEGQSDLPQPGF